MLVELHSQRFKPETASMGPAPQRNENGIACDFRRVRAHLQLIVVHVQVCLFPRLQRKFFVQEMYCGGVDP